MSPPSTRDHLGQAALIAAGLHGALGVLLGAYAAHGMEGAFDDEAVGWVELGSRYQLVHAAALAGVGVARPAAAARPVTLALAVAVLGLATGPLLFSGALYAMGLGGLLGAAVLAPFGGLALIVGWIGVLAAGLAWRGPAPMTGGGGGRPNGRRG